MLLPTPRLCLALGLLLSAWSAQGQESSPYYFGASAGLTHVSNVYRRGDTANSDRVTSLGLLAGLDQRLGRARLRIDTSANNNRYATLRDLNNTSYSGRSTVDWETLGDLSGTLLASRNRTLAEFNIGRGADNVPLPSQQNRESNGEYSALVRLGAKSRYSLEAGWAYRKRDFSAIEYSRFAFSQHSLQVGAYAKPGANLKVGIVGRKAKGKNPRYPVVVSGFPLLLENPYRRTDIDLTASWATGGSSQLDARVSRSRTRNDLLFVNSFSGTTGALAWSWLPTPKLQLRFNASRDTGVESRIQSSDIDRLYHTLGATANYELTGKLFLQASINRISNRRDSIGAYDNDATQSIGVRWAYSRSISLSCQAARSSRDSSVAIYTYRANSLGCTGQFFVF